MSKTHHATRTVAMAATSLGYKVSYCCAASKEAAEYAAERNERQGHKSEAIEVDAITYDNILKGIWNTHKDTPGLRGE